jgi:hypothetical protein
MSSETNPASAGFVLYGVGEHRGAVIRFVQFAGVVCAAAVG